MRRVLGLFLLAFAAATAPDALAQTPSPGAVPSPQPLAETLTGHAKRDYDAARLLFEVGDYAGALARFQNAARVSNDPRLLWNAAACEMKLRRYARALALVRRFLDSGSPLITPEAAERARAFLKAGELLTVRFDVKANQPDAVVYVDGELVGTIPLGPEAALDLGRHEIVVKKEGFADYVQQLTVTGSADLHVNAVLKPISRARRRTWEGSAPIGPHSPVPTAPGLRPVVPKITVLDPPARVVEPVAKPAGLPAWVWIVGGSVLAAGAATFGYFILQPGGESSGPTEGSIATVRLR